jgi:regulator of protease activity HflC (stomatin/prohibitin superfamily)
LTVVVIVGALLVVALFLLILSIKIVPEYRRVVVFRLGRMIGVRGPGIVIIIPLVDRAVAVDLREFYIEIPHQSAITRDNATISIDFITFFRVVDATMSIVAVADFRGAAQNIAATTLRSVVGDLSLDNVLAQRDQINAVLRDKLDEVTERWGVKVTNVEIREIIPPPAVQDAMTRQMSAERTRRALVTEAEGDQQAAILRAEGGKQANILNAEGDRQAAALRAEGFAVALRTVFETARQVDSKTMGLQYLEALKVLGAAPSTKFVLPLELTGMLQGITALSNRAFAEQPPSAGDIAPTPSEA